MPIEIPTNEIRHFQIHGAIQFEDLVHSQEISWILQSIEEKKQKLPKYAHKNLSLSDTPTLIKMLKNRQLGRLASQLMVARTIRMVGHRYCDNWEVIEALEKRPVLTEEELEERKKHAPRTPLYCYLALSLTHGWGCYYKKYPPTKKELQLEADGPFYLLHFTSHPLEETKAPLIYG